MSSVLGLKVRPRMPTRLPLASPPSAAMILSAMERLRASLTWTVVSTSLMGAPASAAVRTRARVSLGKHEPP